MKFTTAFFLLISVVTSMATECKFLYDAVNLAYLSNNTSTESQIQIVQNSTEEFNCEFKNNTPIENRMHVIEYDLEEYPPTDCTPMQPYYYYPEYMNTVKNKKLKLYQTASFMQGIQIQRCQFQIPNATWQRCNKEMDVGFNHEQICHEIFVKVNLQAVKDSEVFSETFYYPSGCVCELLRKF